MDHREFVRYLPGSDRAVLLLHGIAGTPAHFRQFLPLIPQDWSVYNVLLDGHGGEVGDFARSSMAKWKDQNAQWLALLRRRHKKIYIIAHSMGTLLSVQEAIRDGDKIAGLFLLNVPLQVHFPLSTMVLSVKAALGRRSNPIVRAMLDDCSIRLTPKLWRYLAWAPRFWELLVQVRRTRKQIAALQVPCMAFQSRQDELVSMKSCEYLGRVSGLKMEVLEHSGHFCYSRQDMRLLQSRLEEFLNDG